LAVPLALAGERPATPVDQYGDPLPKGAIARLGTVRWRGGGASCLAFSSDSKLLAAGNGDFTARLWNTATGREVRRFKGAKLGQVHHIALSPDGSTLATSDLDNGVLLWDARTGKHLRRVQSPVGKVHTEMPFVFTFSPDSRTLYAGVPGSVSAVAMAEGKVVPLPPMPEPGLSIAAIADDGAAAVGAVGGGRFLVWDLRTGKKLAQVAGPRDSGLIALSRGANRLAVESKEADPTVIVWDLSSQKELCRCKGHQAPVSSLAFSPDGTALATGSQDLTARLWDVASGKERWSFRGYSGSLGVKVAFAPDGKSVAAIGWDGIIYLLDTRSGKERNPHPDPLGLPGRLAVTPDGKAVLTSEAGGSIRLWDLTSGKVIRTLRGPRRDEYDPAQRRIIHRGWEVSPNCFTLTPDGKGLLVSDSQGVRLWDLSDPERPRPGELLDSAVLVALSPDAKLLAAWENRQGIGRLRLVEPRTKKVLCQTEQAAGGKPLFSPDGRLLVIGPEIWLCDGQALRPKAILSYPAPRAFSPDSQLLAGLGRDSVRVWEVASSRWVERPRLPFDVKRAPNDPPRYEDRVAAASAAALVRVIEREDNRWGVLAFSPNGRYLALAGQDRTVSLYDLASGRVVHTFQGHDGEVFCLAFTPDGRRLISGSQDGTALVWDLRELPAAPLREVKRTAAELDALWKRLAGSAAEADAALRELAASPTQAADLVRRSLKPAPKDQSERIAGLIRDLNSATFAKRVQAGKALMDLGEDAAEALRATLKGQPSEEVRRRVEELLTRLTDKGPAPNYLRGLRAIRLLGWLNTPEARRALEVMAAGAPGAARTRAAAATLACLRRR
jgi:WD40 repeat protein